MLMEPDAGPGGSQFGASLDALLQPLSDYIAWADRLLGRPEAAAIGAQGGEGLDAWYAFSPPRAILADAERLIEAVDAFLADPLAPPIRAGLEAALQAVIRPALDQVDARSARLIPAGANLVNADSGGSTHPENRDPRRPSPFDEEPVRPSPERSSSRGPGRGEECAGGNQQDVPPVGAAVAPGAGADAPGPAVEVIRLDEAERQWWQNRFNQLRNRVNAGLSLIVILGIGLLVVSLYETFALRDPTAAFRLNAPGPDNAQVFSGPLQGAQPGRAPDPASLQPLAAGGAEMSDAVPVQAMPGLQARVLEMETQILRLEAGISVIHAELRSQVAGPGVSAESAGGGEVAGSGPVAESDSGAGSIRPAVPGSAVESPRSDLQPSASLVDAGRSSRLGQAAGAADEPAVYPDIERRLAVLEMTIARLSDPSALGRSQTQTQVAGLLQSPLRSPLESPLQEHSQSRSQVPPSGLPLGPFRVDPAPGAASQGSPPWSEPAVDRPTLAAPAGISGVTSPPDETQTGRVGAPAAEPSASGVVATKSTSALANCQAVGAVLDRFGAAYDAGALDALLALYSKDASENATRGHAGIRQMYKDWFGKTSERRMRFSGTRIQPNQDGGCIVSADYRVAYRDAGGRPVTRAGTIELLFDRPGADALIQRIAY